ncbi:MAG: potassium-transporting ATPase subunit KdpA [Actinomycetota bacterium]
MLTFVVFCVLLVAITPPLGAYMHRVYSREKNGRAESLVYKIIGINPNAEQSWRRYCGNVLWFSLVSMLVAYALMRLQHHLPLNPQHLPAVDVNTSFNTATSFTTNTNWQAYGGETTMSYLSQMLALTFQNFVSAAAGMAVLIAMVRGFTRAGSDTLGNFWRDLVRGTLYILLPISVITTIVLLSQGVVQTLGHSALISGIQGLHQTIARGPVASQIAIKQLGTNGGGFFNANSAHPFENPNWVTNFIESMYILWIPAALTYTFGKMVGSARQGWALFSAMFLLMLAGFGMSAPGEHHATEAMKAAGIKATAANMEGKETRIGPDSSSLWAVATTDASNGSVNSMHDSYQPLGQVAPMFSIAIGEVIFGGVGSGLYGMIFYVIVAVFMGGLMVGRTPEYLGKKIQARQVKIVVIAILIPFLVALALAAIGSVLPSSLAARANHGPHGFSEIFYAFLSMSNNNGSAFAGLTASGSFFAIAGGFAMLVGRFIPLIAALALGASVGREKTVPFTAGTLRTDTGLFVGLLIGVIVIIGALTFLPGLALGPIVEHLTHGKLF